MPVDIAATRRRLSVGDQSYDYYSLPAAEALGLSGLSRLPYTLKIILENILRQQGEDAAAAGDEAALLQWFERRRSDREIGFRPVRVLMPDSTGVPLLGDLAAMRDAMVRLGGEPVLINPQIPIDLIVDHSVTVEEFGTAQALEHNQQRERELNSERFDFLGWSEAAFGNVRLIPPGAGICHQINLEYLASVVATQERDGRILAFPDSLVGTDSHTPMINGLGVLGWGVGGLEAATAALGEPISMLIPEVVGCRLSGRLPPGVTSTDLVLSITQRLRDEKVVGAFVEYFGSGVETLTLPERATIANMTPEFGANIGFFAVDAETIRFLRLTGRDAHRIALVEAYAKAQGLWQDHIAAPPCYSRVVEIDLASIQPSLSGPSFPHQRLGLGEAYQAFSRRYPGAGTGRGDAGGELTNGDVVIAAITSCTNTSNPWLMIAAGLLARNAVRRGLTTKPWVKTSLSPGSRAVSAYLGDSGLQQALDELGFNVVGYGCMTCMGNSGPLKRPVLEAIERDDLATVAVLSGNRNFEGRIHPNVKANFLASPPLVVAYALAGSVRTDLSRDPLGLGADGKPVGLWEIWPDSAEVAEIARAFLSPELFNRTYAALSSDAGRNRTAGPVSGAEFGWDPNSTFIRRPPFFDGAGPSPTPPRNICGARILALFGDMITTDHISPIGSFASSTPAGRYLESLGTAPEGFVNYASRRLNHDVMMRGTFANTRIVNEMVAGREGGITRHQPDGAIMSIFDASELYRRQNVPLVIVAGANYGAGSSRDWAAKGPRLLGVRAVIAESFERIHRSNLIGMGILPLQFLPGVSRNDLGLDGSEILTVTGVEDGISPSEQLNLTIERSDGSSDTVEVLLRVDTVKEAEYIKHGGILTYALRKRYELSLETETTTSFRAGV